MFSDALFVIPLTSALSNMERRRGKVETRSRCIAEHRYSERLIGLKLVTCHPKATIVVNTIVDRNKRLNKGPLGAPTLENLRPLGYLICYLYPLAHLPIFGLPKEKKTKYYKRAYDIEPGVGHLLQSFICYRFIKFVKLAGAG